MDPINLLLHLDDYLRSSVQQLGALSYILLFAVIFAETGLVIAPFLPGDSLLFAAGALAGAGSLNIIILMPVLLLAAIAGDSLNYWIGSRLGEAAFANKRSRVFKPEYLKKTHAFYEKYGGKTIIIARFVPIVRTFAPFAAGVARMRYRDFLVYNVIGAALWVTGITLAGYIFGQIPAVQANFEVVVLLIIVISLLPAMVEYIKHRRKH